MSWDINKRGDLTDAHDNLPDEQTIPDDVKTAIDGMVTAIIADAPADAEVALRSGGSIDDDGIGSFTVSIDITRKP